MALDDEAIRRIPVFDVRLEDEHITAVVDTLRSGWLTWVHEPKPSKPSSPSTWECLTRWQ
jgi:hypothetical protein